MDVFNALPVGHQIQVLMWILIPCVVLLRLLLAFVTPQPTRSYSELSFQSRRREATHFSITNEERKSRIAPSYTIKKDNLWKN